MRLRPAAATDAPAIAGLWNTIIRDTLVTFNPQQKTPAEVAALIADRQAAGHCFDLAEDATGFLGFASYGQFRAGAGYARTMEHTVLLAPAARGRGVGRQLMARIEAHAAAGGVHSMIAGVSSGNPDGRAFHAALGYREVARLPQVGWKFDQWLDLVVMQKMLRPAASLAADNLQATR